MQAEFHKVDVKPKQIHREGLRKVLGPLLESSGLVAWSLIRCNTALRSTSWQLSSSSMLP